MDLVKNAKKVAFLADGSPLDGYGHLNRSKNLSNQFFKNEESIFLCKNSSQIKFCKQFSLSWVELAEDGDWLKNKIFDCILVDSKKPVSSIISLLKFRKIILIDHIPPDINYFDALITPSFFYQPEQQDNLKYKHFYGDQYVILDPTIRDVDAQNKSAEKLVISFGGSDPNNISLLALNSLKNTPFIDDVLLILGPGYIHKKTELLKIINTNQIIENPKNIFDYFAMAYFAITALGVTIQELAYLNIPMGIIYNYQDDQMDMAMISDYFSRNKDTNFIYNFSYYKSVNVPLMLETINRHKRDNINIKFNKNFGAGWSKEFILN